MEEKMDRGFQITIARETPVDQNFTPF